MISNVRFRPEADTRISGLAVDQRFFWGLIAPFGDAVARDASVHYGARRSRKESNLSYSIP